LVHSDNPRSCTDDKGNSPSSGNDIRRIICIASRREIVREENNKMRGSKLPECCVLHDMAIFCDYSLTPMIYVTAFLVEA
jgi:hypothetical protein